MLTTTFLTSKFSFDTIFILSLLLLLLKSSALINLNGVCHGTFEMRTLMSASTVKMNGRKKVMELSASTMIFDELHRKKDMHQRSCISHLLKYGCSAQYVP